MSIVLKLLWVILIAAGGYMAYPVTANLLVVSGLLQSGAVATAFGAEMTSKAVLVWLACVPLSVWASFMHSRMRYILLLAPLYAPSLFAVVYVLLNRSGA